MNKFALLALLVLFNFPAQAQSSSFVDFLEGVKQDLKKENIDPDLLTQAMGENPEPIKEVMERLNNQPESKSTFGSYFNMMVSDYRVKNGVKNLGAHSNAVADASQKYGIPEEVIVSLWGIESAYGKLTGGFQIVPSLATLAYQSHRKDFFRRELIKALKIVQEGHIPLNKLTGSWAGAMGQCQFMPSSFFRFAADGNGDGRKDIWQTEADVFASTANYLNESGWVKDKPWGQRVVLGKILPPIKFSSNGLSGHKSVKEWKRLGVYASLGGIKVGDTTDARLFIPNGPSGKAYLVYDNFDIILKWNRSSYFAFSVLSLADEIAAKRKG